MELQRRDRIGRSVCHAKLLHDRGPGGLWRDRQHQRRELQTQGQTQSWSARCAGQDRQALAGFSDIASGVTRLLGSRIEYQTDVAGHLQGFWTAAGIQIARDALTRRILRVEFREAAEFCQRVWKLRAHIIEKRESERVSDANRVVPLPPKQVPPVGASALPWKNSTSMRADCLRYSRPPRLGLKACGPKRKPHPPLSG